MMDTSLLSAVSSDEMEIDPPAATPKLELLDDMFLPPPQKIISVANTSAIRKDTTLCIKHLDTLLANMMSEGCRESILAVSNRLRQRLQEFNNVYQNIPIELELSLAFPPFQFLIVVVRQFQTTLGLQLT